jgi:hypothetical protein
MTMLYFHTKQDRHGETVVLAAYDVDKCPEDIDRRSLTSRSDLKSFGDAESLAYAATKDLGQTFLACDNGSHVWPRYDVVAAPREGAAVSYGFNGDYYPDGYITKVGGTNCSRVYTDTGSVYNRRRNSGSWVKRGGTWSLVMGHVDERNPSF